MKRPYATVCPVHHDGRYTGRKLRLLTAQADKSRHEDHHDCDHVRIEEIDG